jgi:hypothetical protein
MCLGTKTQALCRCMHYSIAREVVQAVAAPVSDQVIDIPLSSHGRAPLGGCALHIMIIVPKDGMSRQGGAQGARNYGTIEEGVR